MKEEMESVEEAKKKIPPVYKVIILGDTNVGKTSLFRRYTDDKFKEAMANTIGVNNSFKKLVIDGCDVNLQMWDTAGQERFKSIVSAFYRESDGFIFVYEINNKRSYEYLQQIIDGLEIKIDPRFMVIVANKMDKFENGEREEDSREEKTRICDEKKRLEYMRIKYKCRTYMASAKTGENVNKMFEDLTTELFRKKKKTTMGPRKILSKKPRKRWRIC